MCTVRVCVRACLCECFEWWFAPCRGWKCAAESKSKIKNTKSNEMPQIKLRMRIMITGNAHTVYAHSPSSNRQWDWVRREREWDERIWHMCCQRQRFEKSKSGASSRDTTKVCSDSVDRFGFYLHDSMRDGGPSELRVIVVLRSLLRIIYNRYRALYLSLPESIPIGGHVDLRMMKIHSRLSHAKYRYRQKPAFMKSNFFK